MTNSQRGAQPQPFSGMNLAGAVDLEALKHKVDAAAGESGGAPAAGGYVTDVDSSGFESMVRMSATYPILLLMWQSDDNRYFDLAGKLADIVNGLKGQIQLARMDIGSNPEIVQALRMQGAPALYALIGGRPMPILQGMPSDDELAQVRDQILPQLIAAARQSGVTGNAPYIGDGSPDSSGSTQGSGGQDASDAGAAGPSGPQIPAGHEEAYGFARNGEYAKAAAAYKKIAESDPHDSVAAREYAKAALLDRNGASDVRVVRQAAGDDPDSVEAQMDAADIDMIGGHIEDAFSRLLDFLAAGHRQDTDAVRQRLLEYFAIPEAGDDRVRRARARLSALMY